MIFISKYLTHLKSPGLWVTHYILYHSAVSKHTTSTDADTQTNRERQTDTHFTFPPTHTSGELLLTVMVTSLVSFANVSEFLGQLLSLDLHLGQEVYHLLFFIAVCGSKGESCVHM